MDPNANLQELEQLLATGRSRSARFKELCVALRNWLAMGGFPPDWSKCPRATAYLRRRRYV